MPIKKLLLKNFKLFKDQEFNFGNINIITGKNCDDVSESSNGSGKSSILEALIFNLYGEGSGKNLQDLISFGKKESSVELQNENIKIIRKIPTDLHIFRNDQEMQFNTTTLRQNALNDIIGNYEFFKKYRLINKQAINLLDLGLISLRKELMQFINADFSNIRQSLLNQKLEREKYSIDKKLYKHYLSEKRLNTLNISLDEIKKEYQKLESEKDKQYGIISQIKSEISSREKIIYNRKRELEEAQKSGICPILKTKCSQITKPITSEQKEKMSQEIEQSYQEIEQYKHQLENEQDSVGYYNDSLSLFRIKEEKAREKLLRLKSAFQFTDYKYTLADIELYSSSIKVLDEFSGWFIQKWLDNLAIVINDLLVKVNLSVTFSADKQFLTITNEGQTMKYESLSSGQQCFLNCIFKIAILLNNGITDGLLLFDEGINVLDKINLKKLIDILKDLQFQSIIIYQNYDLEEENINLISVERKNNESKIK